MKRYFQHHNWISFIILLLLLAACGGGTDEAVEDTTDTDTEAVDEASDSETIVDDGIGATGSEDDSGGLPATPDTGSKVTTTRTAPAGIAASDTAVPTPTPPDNRTGSSDTQNTLELDIVLLLDATGSMTEELAALKARLGELASRLDALPDNISLRYGFVTYRDQAKTDVTQIFDLTDDWALFATNLNGITAVDGNDYAEDLNSGLSQAIAQSTWRPDATRLLILIGDAPPHLDLPETISLDETLLLAVEQNITIYTIGSDGLDEPGIAIYEEIAQSGNGRFLFISDNLDTNQTSATAVYPTANLTTAIADIVLEVLNE